MKRTDPSSTVMVIVEGAPDPIFSVDRKYRYTSFNKAYARGMQKLMGARVKLGESCLDAFSDREERDDAKRLLLRAFRGKPLTTEVEGKAGRARGTWFRVAFNPYRNEKGSVTGVAVFATDITGQKRTEKALRDSEEKFRSLAERTSDWIWEVDLRGRYTYSNPTVRDLLGYKPEEVIGKTPFDLMEPAEAKRVGHLFRRAAAEGEPFTSLENVNLHKNGSRVVLESSGLPIFDAHGTLSGYRGIDRDITARKQSEDALRLSLSQLAATLESTADGILVVDGRGKITLYNEQFARMWNIPVEVLATGDDERALGLVLQHLKDPEGFLSRVKGLYGHPEAESFDVLEFKDGRVFERYSRSQRIEGKPVGRVWSFRDVTKRHYAEEALREKTEELERYFSSSLDLLSIADTDGFFHRLNPEWERTLGYSLAELNGKRFLDFVHPEDTGATLATLAQLARQNEVLNFVNRYRCKDGTYRRLEWRSFPKGKLIYAVARDITERAQAEEKILKLNRVYAVLTNINQLIVRERDRQKLLDGACRIAVDDGRFIMAWIGMLEEHTGAIRPAAYAGKVEGYLDGIPVTSADVPEGRSPAGIAVREGRTVLSNEFAHDARMGPWQERGVALGYRSSAAFPIRPGDTVTGVFMVYSDQPQFFDPDEVQLLEELAMDISFALGSLENEEHRMRAERALRQSEEKYRSIVEATTEWIWEIDLHGRHTYTNQRVESILGYPVHEFLRSDFLDLVHPEDRGAIERTLPSLIASKQGWRNWVLRWHHRDGSLRYLESNAEPILDSSGAVLGFRGADRDITERRKAEVLLHTTNDLLRAIIEAAPTAIMGLDLDGRVQIVWNKAAETMLGWTAEEAMGQFLPSVPAEHVEEFGRFRDAIRAGKTLHGVEVRRQRRDGSPIDYCVYGSPLHDATGKISGNVAVLVDITERKRDEERMKASLREKDLLLKEIHHRVKNNLQIIASMLHMQADQPTDTQIHARLREAQDRVRSIALVHENLYRSTNLAEINFSEYLQDVTAGLYRAYSNSAAKLEIDCEQILLGIDVAIPCGLIVNELVSNALKYAFPDAREGLIAIAMHAEGPRDILLTVQDNGVGIPQNVDPLHAQTLGLTLVGILAEQINGVIRLDRSSGTHFTIRFKRTLP